MVTSTSSGAVKVSTIVRGYHVYPEIWTAPLGEVLFCQRDLEPDNDHDLLAAAIVKDSEVVGHVRRREIL